MSANNTSGLGEAGGIPLGTPASEWSSSTLAALKAPGDSNTSDLRGPNTTSEQHSAPPVGDLTAPTAQTSGFTPVALPSGGLGGLGSSPNVPQPGTSGHSEGLTMDQKLAATTGFTGGLGGGLASSPLVPKPGTSGHSEGLTMAEFQAKKAAEAHASSQEKSNIESALGPNAAGGAGPLGERSAGSVVNQIGNLSLEDNRPVPAAAESSVSSSTPAPAASSAAPQTAGLDTEALKGLSGREQAALQLSGGLGLASGVAPTTLREHGVAGTSGPVSPQQVGQSGLGNLAAASSSKVPAFERSVTEQLLTPGKELPGGWGPVQPVPAPGTAANAPTSIYEDVQTALHAAGKTAFAALPTGVVEKISGHKADGTPIEPNQGLRAGETSPTSGRRGSVAAMFENAKQQVNHLIHDATEVIHPTGDKQPHTLDKFSAPEPERQRRASTMSNTSAGGGEGILEKARDLIGGVLGSGAAALGPIPPRRTSVVSATGVAPATSLPSSEVTGAHPGDHSAGVGALPGSIAETGVAILPDVRTNPDPLDTSTKAAQDLLLGPKGVESTVVPDERGVLNAAGSSAGVAHPVVAAEPAPSASAVPEPHVGGAPLAAPATAPPAGSSVPEPHVGAGAISAPSASSGVPEPIVGSLNNNDSLASGDFAAKHALPDSTIEPAVFHSGATPSETTAPVTDSHHSSTLEKFGLGAAIAGGGAAAAGGVAALRNESAAPPANDRSDSSASVTAIRHGTPGHKDHELPAAAAAAATGLSSVGEGQKMAADETSTVSGAKSLTPGNEHEGVGHPSTHDQPGATREPGAAYTSTKVATEDGNEGITSVAPGSEKAPEAHPAAKDFPHDTSKVSHETAARDAPPATPPKDRIVAPSSPVNKTTTSASSPAPASPTASRTSGHTRTSSNSSGKKVGFMDKLKGEMKVISGKMSKDEAKIKEGERLKHEGH